MEPQWRGPWTLSISYSGATNPPAYHHYLAVDELAGLEEEGYAQLNSGTDVQIESVIPESVGTDFTHYTLADYNEPFALYTTPCVSWYTDDEGGGVGTWDNNEYEWNGNEVYQWVELTDGGGGSYTINIDSTGPYGALSGYYCVLHNSGGTTLASGFTPCTFSGYSSGSYQVEADSYGNCTFDHWSGGGITGDTGDPQAITISGSTTVTAIYTGTNCR